MISQINSIKRFKCERYDPDRIFKKFKVLEFPISLVGLSTSIRLDVEIDLERSAYFKTMCNGRLMMFDESREVSAPHRAFTIAHIDKSIVNITYTPRNECISKIKHSKLSENRFVFDLRLIQIDGIRCCNDELHSELGRYYISGQFEYCKLTHQPKVVDFGNVLIGTSVTKYVRITNESTLMAVKMQYVRVTGFDIVPQSFSIAPRSSKRICITVKPRCLRVANNLIFRIRNPHDATEDKIIDNNMTTDENFIKYFIKGKLKVGFCKNRKEMVIESLHRLHEPSSVYTYVGEEVNIQVERKEKALELLNLSKSLRSKKAIQKFTRINDNCSNALIVETVQSKNFCKSVSNSVTVHDLLDVLFEPFYLDFGRVAFQTYGEEELTIMNKTNYDITIDLLNDNCVFYTDKKLSNYFLKLKALSDIKIKVLCLGFIKGSYHGSFEYVIDKKHFLKHSYSLQVENPILLIKDTSLKFGMATTESFVTSVPVKIFNYFNINVNFIWADLQPDVPFEITPATGTVLKHSCKICDISYVCKATKTKTHEVDFLSISKVEKVIPIELTVTTRKLSIKFLEQAVIFKDIALNLEVERNVKLENSSREIAMFHVLEPLVPGFRIEPMSGIIRPKMIITFKLIIKIACVLEFSFDVLVKINNKENVILPLSGSVVEPKVIVHPKNIYMARIPCDMITYVPVTFQNIGSLQSEVEILDTGDENIFNVFIGMGNEKQRALKFCIDGGASKTVYIKVFDIFRREYEMYIPFKINNLLGPPNEITSSTELQYYIGKQEALYENNLKVKVKSVNKDISYCRISGVITVPWIRFSVDKFEIDYDPIDKNTLNFTMTNISKYLLYVTIAISKILPHFTLNLQTEENQSIITDNYIKFELERDKVAEFSLKFQPKGHGKFVAIALLYLDRNMTIPYYNLTFVGRRQTPPMIPSLNRIIFPPCLVGSKISRQIEIKVEGKFEQDSFCCGSKEETNLCVTFIETNNIEVSGVSYTILVVNISVSCQTTYSKLLILNFSNNCGSWCDVKVSFCFSYCPLTLYTSFIVNPEENPYPYYPLETQSKLYKYMETCTCFLEKWMFQQGFRRDLYPTIPDTFHAISSAISSQHDGTKTKGINVSYLNFVRRVAGPLMKHVRKITVTNVDDEFKCVKEIHDTYKEIINLLRARGADLWILKAKFLLSYDQFVIYSEYVIPKRNADILMTRELISDVNLFYRLNKQSWIDFILQSYKVFVMDSCFFECVCVSSQEKDVIKILIDWYNEQVETQHQHLRNKNKRVKVITNITNDLIDGIGIISAMLNYCPFLGDHFSVFCELQDNNDKGAIINNACLIIEAMNQLRLYFPLTSKDFLQPNFLHMLFLSVHLYIVLPMYKPKDTVKFNPPLLRSSTRLVAINPTTQESLIFNYQLLNNTRNGFSVEKAAVDSGKKMYLAIKYTANFVDEERATLLVHGYNKTRLFDTYIVFILKGCIGSLNPFKKCKVMGPIYRPNKVDVLVSSPFAVNAVYTVSITDCEPTIPVVFEKDDKRKFYLRRLHVHDREVALLGMPKESGQDIQEHKIYLQIICLSTQIGNSWIWFRSEIGEFFVRITTQPRWDLALDTLQAKVDQWPMNPCSCGESCECYRTTVLLIPHRNDLMLKAMRYALMEHGSEIMIEIFDNLIETSIGKIVLAMLLAEGGTNMSDISHILCADKLFRITSRALLPRLDRIVLSQHTGAMLALPITVPSDSKTEKYSVTMTSECGMDIRTYRIVFVEMSEIDESP